MEVLVLEGKNYVKSSVIARELGYTSDYVGQLCRSGKVEAKLFGKTWYVEKDSIAGHKHTRYRSSKAVTKRVLHAGKDSDTSEKIEVRTEEAHAPAKSIAHSYFYAHGKRDSRVRASYSSDSASLIPQPSKVPVKKRLHVELAEAQKVAIDSPRDEYHFEAPTLPEIRFKGRLNVSDYEEETTATDSPVVLVPSAIKNDNRSGSAVHIHPTDTSRTSSKKAKNKVISSIVPRKKGEEHIVVHETAGSRGVTVPVALTERVGRGWVYGVGMSTIFLLLGLVISAVFIAVDAKMSAVAGAQSTEYSLRFENLIEVFSKVVAR